MQKNFTLKLGNKTNYVVTSNNRKLKTKISNSSRSEKKSSENETNLFKIIFSNWYEAGGTNPTTFQLN